MPRFTEEDYVCLPACFPEFPEPGHRARVWEIDEELEEYVLLLRPELRYDDPADEDFMRWPIARELELEECGYYDSEVTLTARLRVQVACDSIGHRTFERLLRLPDTIARLERTLTEEMEIDPGNTDYLYQDARDDDVTIYIDRISDITVSVNPNDQIRRPSGL